MKCHKCGTSLSVYHKFCFECGAPVEPPLTALRRAEKHAKREFKKSCTSVSDVACTQFLADVCWAEAAKKFHPTENKYTLNSTYIPHTAFEEIDDTYQQANILFYLMQCAVMDFRKNSGK